MLYTVLSQCSNASDLNRTFVVGSILVLQSCLSVSGQIVSLEIMKTVPIQSNSGWYQRYNFNNTERSGI